MYKYLQTLQQDATTIVNMLCSLSWGYTSSPLRFSPELYHNLDWGNWVQRFWDSLSFPAQLLRLDLPKPEMTLLWGWSMVRYCLFCKLCIKNHWLLWDSVGALLCRLFPDNNIDFGPTLSFADVNFPTAKYAKYRLRTTATASSFASSACCISCCRSNWRRWAKEMHEGPSAGPNLPFMGTQTLLPRKIWKYRKDMERYPSNSFCKSLD